MSRNVFALQQNLTNIIQFKEVHFDRVRKYYSWLNLSEEELVNSVAGSGFSKEEIEAILEVQQVGERTSTIVMRNMQQFMTGILTNIPKGLNQLPQLPFHLAELVTQGIGNNIGGANQTPNSTTNPTMTMENNNNSNVQ